jgi:lipopolysaccharide/colanic/teichoic acid biosynthesis glycosyltransferase
MHIHRRELPDAVLVTPDTFRVGHTRRALDVLCSGLLLLLTLPVLLLAALMVRATDGGPAFYRQLRVGEGGRSFMLLKLRTMSTRGSGPAVTAAGDARITGVGRILRGTSIDELPQLWHVFRGEMTLVGPRPESLALAAHYPESCRFVLTARPGLTGPAQLRYRERSAVPPVGWGAGWGDVEAWYLQRLVPLRVEADLEYLTRPTAWQTVRYLWRTALFVVGFGGTKASGESIAQRSRAIGDESSAELQMP